MLSFYLEILNSFYLKSAVTFPTRGDRTLDQIFTNISQFYNIPSSLPPFGLSDHQTVFMPARVGDTSFKPKRKTMKARDTRPSKRASLGLFLLEVPWSELLSEQTCHYKLQILTEIINYGLNITMPERPVRMHETDRPWIYAQFKDLIACRQKALASGNTMLFKVLTKKSTGSANGAAILTMLTKLLIFTTQGPMIGSAR